MRPLVIFLAAAIFLDSAAALADTLHVPDDYATIQAAIDAAVDGDEVIVSIGTYNEAIDFLGKAIRVASASGRDLTIIDATGLDASVVTCATGEGRDSVLEGFTVSGGSGTVAEDGRSHGGGMYNDHSSPTIRNCTFSDNTVSGRGGGIANLASEPMIIGCMFMRNSTTYGNSGGAVARQEGSTCVVMACTFEDSVGGGIWTTGGDLRVLDCAFNGNSSGLGGGIGGSQRSIDVSGSSFVNNSATWGGAIAFQSGTMAIRDCSFVGNSATRLAGAVRAFTTTAEFERCVFRGNTAPEGAAIYTSAETVIESCMFEANTATDDNGGAVFAERQTLICRDSEFRWNHANRDGGGIYAITADVCNFENCKFTENTAGSRGGALLIRRRVVSLTGCQFTGNTAESMGGGAFFGNQETVVSNCRFTGNRSSRWAGAIGATSGSLSLANSLFDRNEAESVGGLYTENRVHLDVTNCTFAQNTSEDSCGAIQTGRESSVLMIGSIFWGNFPQEICLYDMDTSEVMFSNVEGGYEGVGNIDVDPLFVDAASGDFRLAAGSPSIDAGDNTAVPADVFDLDRDGDTEEPIPFDLAGLQRFVDDPDTKDTGRCGDPCVIPIVDMGAYEFQAGAGGCMRDPEWVCDGDVDGDGQVNPVDAGLVQAAFGSLDDQELCNYDMDCDGQINPVDAGIVQSLFGSCETPRNACP